MDALRWRLCAETNGRPVCGLLVFAASMDALCAAGQNENIQRRVCLERAYSVPELLFKQGPAELL